jgi:hypothetical protein
MQHGDMDMQLAHAAGKCSMETWICSLDKQHGYAAGICSVDMQHKYAVWTWKHGHEHAAWTLTCITDMDIQHGHRQAASTWTRNIDINTT